MAQSGYTPILIYASGTATNVPLAANMTSSSSGAELALNYADGKLYYKDSGGTVQVLATKASASNTFSAGSTGLTPSTATTGAVTLGGTLNVANGGTGVATLTGIAYGNGTSAFTAASTAQVLSVIGTLPVSNGGTGQTTFTAGQVLYGNGTSGLSTSANMTFDGSTLTTLNSAYTGTLTGGTGIVNLGSGQFYKDASGNVGIGTTSPTGKLDVSGKLSLTGGEDNQLQLTNNSQIWHLNNSTGGQLYIYDVTNDEFPFKINAGSGSDSIDITSTYTAFGTAGTERMRIDSSGNLLVGTTSNGLGSKINVNGQISVNSSSSSILNYVAAYGSATGTAYFGYFTYNGTAVGQITSTGSITLFTSLSDYRLKDNVAPMICALDTVAKLKPVTYTWKNNGEHGQGFIAHELAEVVPDCVSGEKDAVNEDGSIKPQGIDTSFLVATLTAALQELNAKVDAQQALIENLTTRLTALENK